MKKYIIVLVTLLNVFASYSQNIGDALYIYRNDDDFNAFLREEVDSMVYSYYDADSVLHNDIVSQVVYTEDSIYVIPLAAIDSVSFVQPETIYSQDVMHISLFKNYVTRVDGKTLYISGNIPSSLKPEVGKIIIYEEFDETFPNGFAGRITNISEGDEIKIECTQPGIDEIYEQVVECVIFGPEGDGAEVKSQAGHRKTLFGHTYTFPIKLNGEALKCLGAGIDGSVMKSIKVKHVKRVKKKMPPYSEYSINVTNELKATIYSKVGFNYSMDDFAEDVAIPFVTPSGIQFKWLIYPSIDISASAGFNMSFSKKETLSFGIRQYEDKIEPFIKRSPKSVFVEPTVDGDVSVFVGVGGLVSMGLWGDLVAITATLKAGFNGEAEYTYFDNPFEITNAYDSNKDKGITVCGRVQFDLKAGAYVKFGKMTVGKAEVGIQPFKWDFLKKKYYWYPLFSDVKGQLDENNAAISAVVSRDVAYRYTKVGLAVYDKYDKLKKKYYHPSYYFKESDFNNPLSFDISDLEPGKQYKVYPIVSSVEKEYLATPYKKFGEEVNVETGEAKDVKSTSAKVSGQITKENSSLGDYGIEYKKVGSNEWRTERGTGLSYDGTFDVELDNLEKETRYSYRAFAIIRNVYFYGDEREFSTTDGLSVSTLGARDVSTNSATLNGQFIEYDESVLGEYGIGYSTTSDNFNFVPASSYSDDGKFSVEINDLEEETKYYYVAYAYNKNGKQTLGEVKAFETSEIGSSCPDGNHPHMIDLGTGVKWSCCNVGANKPEENGQYFAWGETYEKNWYSPGTYDYSSSNSMVGLWDEEYKTFYNPRNIGKNISNTSYDAAKGNWGSPWRMPTLEELKALLNCRSKWSTVNGVQGIKFIGQNGNCVFFPAAGIRIDDGVYNNKGGDYWTGTLSGDSWYAYKLNFNNSKIGQDYETRSKGCTIRPVCE